MFSFFRNRRAWGPASRAGCRLAQPGPALGGHVPGRRGNHHPS